jgi:hypothetical protein
MLRQETASLTTGGEKLGIIRRALAVPFYGYSAVCAVAAIACPPVLLLGAASLAAGAAIDDKDE